MEIQFNCTGAERKKLAQAIGTIVGAKAEYQFMPTCAYTIGNYTLDKEGTLQFDETVVFQDEVKALLHLLEKQGFTAEPLDEAESNTLTITMPLNFFDDVTFANLDRLLENKGNLIKHALGTDSLAYGIEEETVEFPWFTIESEHDADAYSHFISAICDMAKNQKRINNKPDTSDNEKYTFRCFLLRLGFIGTEYKTIRKVLLRKLSGSSAFRHGGYEDAVSE